MTKTLMRQEIEAIPNVIASQICDGYDQYFEVGQWLSNRQGPMATNARGTSDHAASYFKMLVETRLGKPVASIPPSVSSIYHAPLRFENGSVLSISQSGGSTDLLVAQNAIKQGGAFSVALVNTINAPLALEADSALDLLAGPEKSVAATKSFAASLFAGRVIVAGMQNDTAFLKHCKTIPDVLSNLSHTASELGDNAIDVLKSAHSIFTISRGAGLAIAAEAALKLKETCLLHAECYSAAEVVHGPMILARKQIVVLAFLTDDEGNQSVLETINLMRAHGAKVIEIPANINLPNSPLLLLQQIMLFYQIVEKLSLALGQNPDIPPMLKKITVTV